MKPPTWQRERKLEHGTLICKNIIYIRYDNHRKKNPKGNSDIFF